VKAKTPLPGRILPSIATNEEREKAWDGLEAYLKRLEA
jgi:hypothetical protein